MPPNAEINPPLPESPLTPERVRDDFRWVYGELGGREALLSWSRENEKEFFRMFFQLLPRETGREPAGEALEEALRELEGSWSP